MRRSCDAQPRSYRSVVSRRWNPRHPLGPSPVILVTGASTGIGLALAQQLRSHPTARVVLTAREPSLTRLVDRGVAEGERLRLRALDVASTEQRREVVAEIRRDWGGVDALVNNAAVTYRAVSEHLRADEALDQLTTNFLGPMDLTRLVLPEMREKRRGRIINVSSVSGMMAMPTMGAYSASKFAFEGASESLWYEMKPWNIRVTLVQPGFIHSNAFLNVRLSLAAIRAREDENDPYYAVYAGMEPFIERLMALAFATPDSVARKILSTLHRRRPPLRVSASIDARFFYLLRRLLPRRAYHSILYHSLPGVQHWGPESRRGETRETSDELPNP
jgi:NAD(P)-dependent dehydrogenase (short-subunit alcohol dehydrogenase family)